MNILCIIPARSGSKGIPNKNIKLFKGLPLLVHSINQAKCSKYYNSPKHNMKIFVSTDSKEYADIAKEYGAEVPFLRPEEISKDESLDYEFISHALVEYDNLGYNPDIIMQLRPTQPCRKVEDINNSLDIFINNFNDYDSLRSVIPIEKSPFKMYVIEEDNNDKIMLNPLFNNVKYNNKNIKEPYNECRQYLPQAYLHNGYIDVLKASIVKNGTITGDNIYPYVMNKNDVIDIDTEEDWKKAESVKISNLVFV